MKPLALRRKQQLVNTVRRLITKTEPKSPVSEQYRTLRTNISFSSVDKEIKTLMITSTGPSEGKSTTSANLAIVFAQQGKKVLLVDADMRKPTIHYTFSLNNILGLTSVLSKQTTLEAATQKSDVENLDLLSCGPIPPNPAELLGSNSMSEFLAAATSQYDLVLFDTPPVLAVTDGQILANKCDGTVLVVSSGTTEIDKAEKAKELLESAQAKLLGVVLNRREMKNSNYYYYYGTQ